MQTALWLHRGDGTKARIDGSANPQWLEIHDEKGSELVIFIPSELKADAQAFADSINTYCQRRIGASV